MFEFESPYYFILLLLIPVGIVAQNSYVKWQTEKQAAFGEQQAMEKLLMGASINKSRVKFMLQIMAVFFIVLALVNPKLGSKVEAVPAKGVEIVFAIDVSKSMLCTDIQPNRLEKSKQIITQIINSIGSDRIGIVAYAGSAYPGLPMTTDYELAKMFTQSMNTDIISSQGTAIESAIQTSVDFFDNPTSGKAIILLSDGEDHENTSFEKKNFPITLVCDHIYFQQNIGSLFRIGEAFGIGKIIFIGKDIPLTPRKINKTSRSTHLQVPHTIIEETESAIDYLLKNKYEIIALEIAETSSPINEIKVNNNQKTALLIGSEIAGISEPLLAIATQITHITMFGSNSSMNVVQATSIALYEITNKLNQ